MMITSSWSQLEGKIEPGYCLYFDDSPCTKHGHQNQFDKIISRRHPQFTVLWKRLWTCCEAEEVVHSRSEGPELTPQTWLKPEFQLHFPLDTSHVLLTYSSFAQFQFPTILLVQPPYFYWVIYLFNNPHESTGKVQKICWKRIPSPTGSRAALMGMVLLAC